MINNNLKEKHGPEGSRFLPPKDEYRTVTDPNFFRPVPPVLPFDPPYPGRFHPNPGPCLYQLPTLMLTQADISMTRSHQQHKQHLHVGIKQKVITTPLCKKKEKCNNNSQEQVKQGEVSKQTQNFGSLKQGLVCCNIHTQYSILHSKSLHTGHKTMEI